mmetsp:Transcript_7190/g.14409  ORF Transcript_7190/g.14409 Transcript_7190/m.14409 type:complete len:147 (+) Transcript_7190:149-589(+)
MALRELDLRQNALRRAMQAYQFADPKVRRLKLAGKNYVMVRGWIDGSKNLTGVRQSVYNAAAGNVGMCIAGADEDPYKAHKEVIFYKGDNLHFELYSLNFQSGRQFIVLFSTGRRKLVHTAVEGAGGHRSSKPPNIFYDDYDSADE